MRNRTALITGGASGIGRALGEEMARRGATVVLADRQLALAEEVAAGIERGGGRAWAVELDVRAPEAFAEVAKQTQERTGSVDYLFNNAGIGVGGEVADYDREAWDMLLDVNVRGVCYGIQAVYPIMRAQGSGHIINTASMAGFIPMAGAVGYGTSKHAVVGMSKSLRIEAAMYGVRCSALCPGAIQTPILLGGKYGRKIGRRLPESKLKEMWDGMRPMDVDAFAVEVLKDVEANEPYIIVPRWWKAVWLFERLAPKTSLRLWTRFYAKNRAQLDAHGVEDEIPTTTDVPVHAE